MNCKNCGFQLTPEDMFCKNCGARVNADEGQNMVGQATVPNMQQQVMDNQADSSQNQAPGFGQQPVMENQQPMIGVNPTPMQQQPMWNSQGPAPMPGPQPQPTFNAPSQNQMYGNQAPKSNPNLKFIIIGAVVVIVAIIIAIVVLGKGNNSGSGTGGSGGKIVANNSTYSVNFKGFKFKIPTDMVYEKKSSELHVSDEKGTWLGIVEIEKLSFAQVEANKSALVPAFQQTGYTASNVNQKTYGGLNFITLELAKSGQKMLAGITKANSMYVFAITAYSATNNYDYSVLTKMADILKNAEYTGETSSITVSDIELPSMEQIFNEIINTVDTNVPTEESVLEQEATE